MGACCTKVDNLGSLVENKADNREYDVEEGDHIRAGEGGARVRLLGSSEYTSMFTQQGRKGINQDAMTVWEDFTREGTFFCGVFDGHGPSGHKIARHIRDRLPAKISSTVKLLQLSACSEGGVDVDVDVPEANNNKVNDNNDGTKKVHDRENCLHQLLPSWEASLIKSYKEVDEELSLDNTIESYCSGTTAVTIIKQDEHLIIANLGDSRAVLGTRNSKNQLVPVQLTVDLKPNNPSEVERIKKCNGRVFSLDTEPEVFRIWMPDEDCPGLAMARAFGDFCLKDYGLIPIPEVSYRRLTTDDEFVVIATDGIWDVLTNEEVVKIVASARKRAYAARLLVYGALRAWRTRYPGCKVDDCAAICLFLKDQTLSTKSLSEKHRLGLTSSELSASDPTGIEECQEFVNGKIEMGSEVDIDEVSRVDSVVKLPRYNRAFDRQRSA